MATTRTAEENKRLARRYPEEVASEGAVDRIDELRTPDVVDHSPIGEVWGGANNSRRRSKPCGKPSVTSR